MGILSSEIKLRDAGADVGVRSLFSPIVDFLLIGGLAILVYFAIQGFAVESHHFNIPKWMWLLAFLVNGPHFLISYEIFYGAHGRKVVSSPRFIFAGIFVPVLLLLVMVVGFVFELKVVFVGLLYTMFFTVGWHYIKQAYGCFVVYSAGQKVYFDKREQWLLKSALYPLWWASFAGVFAKIGVGAFYGLQYRYLGVLDGYAWVLNILGISGVSLLLFVLLRRKLLGRSLPGLVALTPLLAIYVWLWAPLKNDAYFYMIPFFHSLQYLLFSGTFTRGKVNEAGRGISGYLWWWGGAFILAALAFHFVPKGLDSLDIHSGQLSPELFMVSFLLFINIHHYFIDNVIWRGDNPEVRKYVSFRGKVESSGSAK